MPASPVRRAERSAQTRHALVEASLRLFATKGYEATSTEEIAEAAGVSPRTFFRYFPTKESVLFFGAYDFMRSFHGVFIAQPPGLSDLDAARHALVVLAPGVSRLRERIQLYELAVGSSMVLRGREQVNREQHARTMAEAIAERRGLRRPDAACELLASICHVVLRRALEEWLHGPVRGDLAVVLGQQFDLLATEVARASVHL
ncbi:MAG: TetR family transcriptional regulator [Acidimicrobiia bacterium]